MNMVCLALQIHAVIGFHFVGLFHNVSDVDQWPWWRQEWCHAWFCIWSVQWWATLPMVAISLADDLDLQGFCSSYFKIHSVNFNKLCHIQNSSRSIKKTMQKRRQIQKDYLKNKTLLKMWLFSTSLELAGFPLRQKTLVKFWRQIQIIQKPFLEKENIHYNVIICHVIVTWYSNSRSYYKSLNHWRRLWEIKILWKLGHWKNKLPFCEWNSCIFNMIFTHLKELINIIFPTLHANGK